MFLNFFKNLMPKTTKPEDAGVSASDMKLADLKSLAVSMKLFTEEKVSSMKRKDILSAVHAEEERILGDESRPGLKRVVGATPAVSADLGVHEGKKVLKRTPVVLNGLNYVDILVESGETYRERA
jgi:hypothetical protein